MIAYGFENPSPIQQKGILAMLKGKDLIAQAPAGTGKTAVFAISILQIIDHSSPNCQALVLAPTRELAVQIQRVIAYLGEYLNVSVHVCTGGTSVGEDVKILKKGGVQVIVGTPGRINDMRKKGHINMDNLKIIVLDEADGLFGGDVKDSIEEVFQSVPRYVQVEYSPPTRFCLKRLIFRIS